MEFAEFTGKNTEDALLKAQQHFALPLDRLHVEVVHAGSGGLFGLFGAKKAVVRARPLPDSSGDELAEMMADLSGATRPAPASPGQTPAVAGEVVEALVDESELAVAETDGEGGGFFDDEDEAPAVEGRLEDESVAADARAVLARLIAPLDEKAVVGAQNTDQGIMLDISGDEAGVLIGRRGQTLEALQYLTTRIVSHKHGRPVRVHVDAGGYRRRRRQSLEELALRLADKARATGRPVSLGPICAPERRIVHMALRAEAGISTISRGRGELKKVVISPRR
ncbi:single-stranded nucleic acid binding R3H domain protein [Desulfarculus baarsii DSM 2075]|uniref:RNA-binding protein KhpB n=1 Tax=Desulfarculus baarsii (strain ATCC 33931 / DSM 2075 / LMG 7858 / VKM B-1802 / 2st14) TaxID=644282 RepID=E1QGD6_DESB2|nr:RNA-binding cell elongation regulator Jag/EloR [Desulfarculus baarsii]ADK83648.1 single-stranded nucleic acid binding R3H domain protein [Desulfarculus baarsii DSM 2075]